MRALLIGLLLVVAVAGGLKLAGVRLPIFDYPLGGTFTQPQIDVVRPSFALP